MTDSTPASFATATPPGGMVDREYTAQVGGVTWTLRTGKLAEQAGGAVTVQLGETIVLATGTISKNRRPISFLPLSVDLEERIYAAGRIPGSFFRREGRPSEVAILTARLIDRPLRPLFPKSLRNEIQVIITALSSDGENYLDIPSVVGASAALHISNAPLAEAVAAVRVGMVEGQFVVNPTATQMESSDLDLRIAGTESAILMVECGAKEVDEAKMVEAMLFGHREMQPLIQLQNQMRADIGKPKGEFALDIAPPELDERVKSEIGAKLQQVIVDNTFAGKPAQNQARDAVKDEWMAAYVEGENGEPPRNLAPNGEAYPEAELKTAFSGLVRNIVRGRILEGTRPDGRAPADLRGLTSETSLLPRTHGTGLFKRGETQVLSICTLGTLGEEQRLDTLRPEKTKRFMHHYNFPPFSTGETWFLRGPKRREIGHGALVEAALKPVIPEPDEFPYALRVVSEVLSSNGSTSQASVCATTLALMDAGVPITMPVAGIAMGLVSDPSAGKNVVLTDIQGMEDALGDMDFKVAGTEAGITALQMDIKVEGLDGDVLRQALQQARDARMQLLDHMAQTLPEPRENMSPYAPRILTIHIDPEYIGKLIGPGGKNIRALEADCGVKIDIQEDGTVYVASPEGAGAERAVEIIAGLSSGPELGKTYTGSVVRTTDFGAFVEIMPGVDGMVHISQLAPERVGAVTDVAQVGDEVLVMVTDVQDGKVRLSRRAVLEGWSLEEARQNDAGLQGGGGRRGGGGGRGGRGGGRDRRR